MLKHFLILLAFLSAPILSWAESPCLDPTLDPLLIHKTSAGDLNICAIVDSEEPQSTQKNVIRVTAFKLIASALPQGKRVIYENKSELDHFEIESKGAGLKISRLIDYRGTWVPFTSSTVTCTKTDCHLAKAQCVFKSKKAEGDDSVSRLSKAVSSKESWSEADSLIIRARDEALSGNKEALTLLNSAKLAQKVDGAASEELTLALKLLRLGKNAGCWK